MREAVVVVGLGGEGHVAVDEGTVDVGQHDPQPRPGESSTVPFRISICVSAFHLQVGALK